MRTTILAAACVACLSAPALAFEFGTPSAETLSTGVGALVAGDVNGDQLDDIVAGDAVYLQQPNGSFAAPQHYPDDTVSQFGTARVLVDFNGDGVLDIVTCRDGTLTVLAANTTGGFTKSTITVATPANMTIWTCKAMTSLDVNQDGHVDLVTLSSGSSVLTFFFGDGHGHVASTGAQAVTPTFYNDLQSGDVTADGLADIVLAGGNTLDVYPGKRGGGLDAVQSHSRVSWDQQGLAIGDVNGDGLNDVVASEYANAPYSMLDVYLQAATSPSTLFAPTTKETANLPWRLLVTDLDHDGRNDLLVGHSGAIGRYMGTSSGLGAEVISDGFYSQGDLLAVADIDDDGCTDAIVGGSYGVRYILPGTGCVPRKAHADFDGDGKSDLVWRNAQTGGDAIWKSANSTTAQVVTAVTNLAWQIVGSGDFNGDGKADLLWHKANDGSNAIWLSGNSATPQSMMRVTNLAWEIVGIGDFDGNRIDDVLWRNRTTGANVIWLGANAAIQLPVATLGDVHWRVAGVDDFDGDGKADILWHHDATGASAIWSSADYRVGPAITRVTDLNWRITGTGDFDGDGKADILWRNAATGSNAIWRAGNSAAQMRIAPVSGNWSVVVGDFNGDRKADVLWRSQTNGVNVAWRAAQLKVQLPVTDIANTAWRPVP